MKVMPIRKQSPIEIKTTEVHMCTLSVRLNILSRVPFFRDLHSENLEAINQLFHEEGFDANEIICHAGDQSNRLFVVAEGRVKLLQHSFSGKNILLDMLMPGEYFGRYSRQADAVYTETAQAQTRSCILVIDREKFQQVLNQYPSVALRVIDIMAQRLQSANERVHQLSTMAVENRIASVLLMLSEKFGEKRKIGWLIQVPLTREDLADMTGTTIESTSRVMSEFRKDGLVQSGRGWVAVVNKEELRVISEKYLE